MTETQSLTNAQAHLLNTLNATSAEAQRALRQTSSEAINALVAITDGTRFPHDAASLGRTAAKAVAALGQLEALLALASSQGLTEEDLLVAYSGEAPYFQGQE